MKLGIVFLILLPWPTTQMEHLHQTEGNSNLLEKGDPQLKERNFSKGIKARNNNLHIQRKKNKDLKPQQQQQQQPFLTCTNITNRRLGPPARPPRVRLGRGKRSNSSSSQVPLKGRSGQPGKGKRMERKRRGRTRHRQRNDISLWIDENQVRMFSGYNMEIYAIVDGRVMPYILDPDFEDQLPVIPSEVENVNFTWKSNHKRYYYNFDLLTSFDQQILDHPFVSINKKGRVPRRPKVFSVRIPCAGNASGVATFGIGLRIQSSKGVPLPDTPLRLRLRKKCELAAGPYVACDEKCENGGVCDVDRRCRCPMGYMGPFCDTALCYPQCRNGGTCSSPGRCSCPAGYHGRICEGGICRNKCLNGGKCIQKDTCSCQKGYYGNRCEFST